MLLLHKECGHVWNYKGQSKIYATCPNCQKKIKIEDSKEK